MRRLLLTLLVLEAALLHSGTSAASAQVDAQISELNSQALEAYQALDIDTARGKLEQAIGLAQQSGMAGPLIAQTYVNLGVVYVAGMSDRDHGLTAFVSGMCMQPDVQLDPLLSTPDVQQVFAQAQQDAQSGACGPAGPAPPGGMMPGPGMAPGPVASWGSSGPRSDAECPPGVKCGGEGDTSGPTDFARGFVNLEFAYGLSWTSSGMKADSKPNPLSDVFIARTDQVFVDANHNMMMDPGEVTQVPRLNFDQSSAWVPDADSFDDFENPDMNIPRGITPVSAACKADGKRTGPVDLTDPTTMKPYTTIEPSSYCVRVEKPGFVSSYALRINPGYFITKTFALSVPLRVQFAAGKGTLSHVLLGLRGELLFSPMDKATGFPVSWFFGGTFGQVQVKPPTKDPARKSPFIVSGPFGVHTGVNVRFRVHRNFGFILSPEFNLLFPDLLFHIDISGGVEGAF